MRRTTIAALVAAPLAGAALARAHAFPRGIIPPPAPTTSAVPGLPEPPPRADEPLDARHQAEADRHLAEAAKAMGWMEYHVREAARESRLAATSRPAAADAKAQAPGPRPQAGAPAEEPPAKKGRRS